MYMYVFCASTHICVEAVFPLCSSIVCMYIRICIGMCVCVYMCIYMCRSGVPPRTASERALTMPVTCAAENIR